MRTMYELSNLRSHRIKYRAYDDTLCKMLKPLTLEEIFKGDFGNTNLYQLTMMEYIGHKDGNGTEIYEGDIIADTTANYAYVVVRGDFGFMLKPMLNQRGLAVNQSIIAKGGTKLMPEYPEQTFEEFGGLDVYDIIVGNVFENSDIIGGKPWKS